MKDDLSIIGQKSLQTIVIFTFNQPVTRKQPFRKENLCRALTRPQIGIIKLFISFINLNVLLTHKIGIRLKIHSTQVNARENPLYRRTL